MTSRKPRPLSPHIQIYNLFKITSLTSILHRITGICLVGGSLLIVWWLMAIACSEQSYATFNHFIQNCFVQLCLVGFTWAFWYHLLNGVRHLVWDTGAGFTKKVYPITGKIVLIGSILVTIASWAYIWSL
jgi:succinate dehydrogenase / fumarate reductase, cytochrome b subunit